ncbi:TSUP family transporter, partial [Bradyrhizobium sp. NBAIM08]|uniref:TSUP family transporter n=1 Tax=Bradyrhizobium sp. NBAIM08 TaxID=2793815 RepID=UPI001CD35D40
LYLLALNMQKLEFVGTIAWMFLIINLVKVPFSAHLGLINPASLFLNALLIPGVVVGIFMGRLFVGKISQRAFDAFLLISAAIASVRLIWWR